MIVPWMQERYIYKNNERESLSFFYKDDKENMLRYRLVSSIPN